ncbi:hypothetical protein AHMF7605_18505 [Adhaeribacter arboris]|uniref:Peptidase S74 domain-containing protein n=1 Tax=Adhaeribacter arboris TaxID=2072846 RepID=A0A2T2YIN0_9BACT|nr:tail fiber domain-containing protein [Adhaeribacter arboris]PSR55356.1 hypothetical protein AHMF7605_18505 [Adhaeribacter arboris]
MKTLKLTFVAVLVAYGPLALAQTGTWNKAGNSLAGTEKLGSTNNKPLRLFTNNTQRLTIDGSGKVGIGVTAAKARLHVADGSSSTEPLPNATMVTESSSDNFLNILAPGNHRSGILFSAHSNPIAGGFIYNNEDATNSLQFLTSGATRMALTAAGLGIGTVAPKTNLHVFKGTSGAGAPHPNASLIVESSKTNFINLLNPNASTSGILFGNSFSNSDGGIIFSGDSTPRGLQFNTGGNSTRMVVASNGFVGIGTKKPKSTLHIVHSDNGSDGLRLENSTASKSWNFITDTDGDLQNRADGKLVGFFDHTSGAYVTLSDMRSKKDIEKAPDVLDKVLRLDVMKYHFLESAPSDKKQYGMIAQNVEKLFPEIVFHKTGNGQDQYAVNYSAYGVIAIKAIQEQQQKIAEQEQTNQQQQQLISTLEERIVRLEEALNKNASKSTFTSNNRVSSESGSATLEQNQPNPFGQSTIIRYYLPSGSTGQINLYDTNGLLVKSLKATENGQAIINRNELKAGIYTYNLSVNGKVVAAKKLVVTN